MSTFFLHAFFPFLDGCLGGIFSVACGGWRGVNGGGKGRRRSGVGEWWSRKLHSALELVVEARENFQSAGSLGFIKYH